MSGDREQSRIETLLQALLETQQEHLAAARELASLQRQTVQLLQTQHDRAEKINARAEAIQERQASLVRTGQRMVAVIVPTIVVVLIILVLLTIF